MLVLDSDDTPTLASQFVRGTLMDLGYDSLSGDVVVRFEAIRVDSEGVVTSRRFEARESVAEGEAFLVGPALNRTANTVAGEVADWVIAGE